MADEQPTAATKRTVDADRQRVLDLLHGFQRFIRAGGGDHWDSVGGDRHRAVEDVRYAIDAVRRFPAVADDAPITLATTAARMKQLRALCASGHLRREELDLLASSYLEESGDGR